MMSNIDIINKIKTFDKNDQIHILKILLNQCNINYSENKNGTFFNMNDIENNTIEDIVKYIHYVEQKEDDINKIEKKMNTYRRT
jgi:hypothetical protein